MTDKPYIIVGREVDAAAFHLHQDESISRDPGNGSQPLDVEFIGRLVTRLSSEGPEKSMGKKAAYEKQVKHALEVREASDIRLTEAEKEEIFEGTTVEIRFETRERRAAGDKNLRILVVPADGTLQKKMDQLADEQKAKGFLPPLSYELDQKLVLSAIAPQILQIVQGFGATQPNGWTQPLQDALNAHVRRELDRLTTFVSSSGSPATSVKNQIMADPVRSFHRSVGIYATNMCR